MEWPQIAGLYKATPDEQLCVCVFVCWCVCVLICASEFQRPMRGKRYFLAVVVRERPTSRGFDQEGRHADADR